MVMPGCGGSDPGQPPVRGALVQQAVMEDDGRMWRMDGSGIFRTAVYGAAHSIDPFVPDVMQSCCHATVGRSFPLPTEGVSTVTTV